MALGGIENPRALLLASNDRLPNGIGNQNDLVGRYFMEHPVNHVGFYVATESAGYGEQLRLIAPNEKFMKEAKIANAAFRFFELTKPRNPGLVDDVKSGMKRLMCSYDAAADLGRVFGSWSCRYISGTGRFEVMCEQVPNPNSRVSLGTAKDRFGVSAVSTPPSYRRCVGIG